MGIFILITIEESWATNATAQALVRQCPVEIFAWQAERLIVQKDQEDECTLCELCLATSPAGALTIHKLYKDEILRSRGKGGDKGSG